MVAFLSDLRYIMNVEHDKLNLVVLLWLATQNMSEYIGLINKGFVAFGKFFFRDTVGCPKQVR